jgi:hypothetical protein
MKLTSINCKEKQKGSGYLHSVFERTNGKAHLVFACKFSSILCQEDLIQFTANPLAFAAAVELSE